VAAAAPLVQQEGDPLGGGSAHEIFASLAHRAAAGGACHPTRTNRDS
jgi:hypothetical protein